MQKQPVKHKPTNPDSFPRSNTIKSKIHLWFLFQRTKDKLSTDAKKEYWHMPLFTTTCTMWSLPSVFLFLWVYKIRESPSAKLSLSLKKSLVNRHYEWWLSLQHFPASRTGNGPFNSYTKITAELLGNSWRLKIQDYLRLGKIKSYLRIKVNN